jgi:hypothetical protein
MGRLKRRSPFLQGPRVALHKASWSQFAPRQPYLLGYVRFEAAFHRGWPVLSNACKRFLR